LINFQIPTLSDKGWVDTLLRTEPQRACDYNFANLFMWGPVYKARIARLNGRLAVQVKNPGPHTYLWPVGAGDVKDALLALEADAAEWDRPFHLAAVTQEQREQLEALFPGQFRYTEQPADFDYLYTVNRLADLEGKKLHAKRNHINRFLKDHPNWVYEEITPKNLSECLVMDEQWFQRSRMREGITEERDLDDEGLALRRATDHFQALGLEGGLIRVYGEVVAFTIGDTLGGDTYDVHYEKAYNELQGAYAIINRCFADQVRRRHPEIVYLNRENDMGVEGLKKAKESYYPDVMVAKYSAVKIVR
jgi:hypothetical protein